MDVLHKKWLLSPDADLRMEPYDSNIVGVDAALKRMRNSQADLIESTDRFPLLFRVQIHIEDECNLAWRGQSVNVLYLNLKAYVETNTHGKSNQKI